MVILYISLNPGKAAKSLKEFGREIKENVLKGIDKLALYEVETRDMKNLLSESLDTMFKLNDDLIEHENKIENYLKQEEKRIYDLVDKSKDKDFELNITINNSEIPPEKAITNFKWSEQKYPRKSKAISDVMEKLYKKYTESQKQLKNKYEEYQNLMNTLNLKIKGEHEAQSLMRRDYRDLIKLDSMIETDYLCTVLCFVPIGTEKYFLEKYESLAGGFVLEGSAEKLGGSAEDGAFLYRVLVMKHAKAAFKTECQGTLRVNCRDFDKEILSRREVEKGEIMKLKAESDEKRMNLMHLSKSAYSEIFIALLHIKMLRIYIESNLKYSSPDYFTYIIDLPKEKQTKTISLLIKKFSDPSEFGLYGTKDETKDSEDFFPFILIRLTVPSKLEK